MSINRVCQITTAHRALDDRIFYKECMALANAGYAVTLIGNHNKNEIVNGVEILSLPKPKNRFHRMFWLVFKVLFLALKQKADIYHFHDPELLPVGILLKLFSGRRIIYDVHEDYEQKILSKEWIRKEIRKPISILFGFLEKLSSLFFDYIITADSHTRMKFNNSKSQVIANFVPLTFADNIMRYEKDNNTFKVIYAGGISEDRGIYVMIEAMEYLKDKNIELHILGEVNDHNIMKLLDASGRIKYYGYLPWIEVSKHLINADIGLILLQPVPAYLYCPSENIIKLFEYMIVGLPVIISDFPRLKKLISDINCGIAVNPTDPEKIAEAIEYLYINPDIRKQMGENGRKAVYERYNWEKESDKLVKIYRNL